MKKVRILLPTLALVFAIVGAFASHHEVNNAASVATIDYWEGVTDCPKVTCTDTNGAQCKQSADLFSTQAACPSGSPISSPLYEFRQ